MLKKKNSLQVWLYHFHTDLDESQDEMIINGKGNLSK